MLPGLWVALGATLGLHLCIGLGRRDKRAARRHTGGWWLSRHSAYCVGGGPWKFSETDRRANELELETPFLRHNIALTRAAYGVDKVDVRFHATDAMLNMAQMRENQSTIDNIRIWDHRPLSQTFRQLQQIRTDYSFSDVDVDRYWINGEYRQVMLAARELSADLPGQGNSWVNRHLQYTHGYGLAMCLAAEKDDQGGPVFTVKDLPPKGASDLKVSRPEIYYGIEMTSHQLAPPA